MIDAVRVLNCIDGSYLMYSGRNAQTNLSAKPKWQVTKRYHTVPYQRTAGCELRYFLTWPLANPY